MKRVLIIVASAMAGVVCALVLLPQRTRTVTVRPGMVRVTAEFDDGSPASFLFVNVDGRVQMQSVPGVLVERFEEGTHEIELVIREQGHNSSAKYTLEVVVEGTPMKAVQDVTVDVWRVTARGAWNAAKHRWEATRFIGTTRNVTVHVRTPDGGVFVDAGVICDTMGGHRVRTDARGDADCGLQKGALKVLVIGTLSPPTDVADGQSEVTCKVTPM